MSHETDLVINKLTADVAAHELLIEQLFQLVLSIGGGPKTAIERLDAIARSQSSDLSKVKHPALGRVSQDEAAHVLGVALDRVYGHIRDRLTSVK
jgi:hypothetical protein